jgi:hypothetical protein
VSLSAEPGFFRVIPAALKNLYDIGSGSVLLGEEIQVFFSAGKSLMPDIFCKTLHPNVSFKLIDNKRIADIIYCCVFDTCFLKGFVY